MEWEYLAKTGLAAVSALIAGYAKLLSNRIDKHEDKLTKLKEELDSTVRQLQKEIQAGQLYLVQNFPTKTDLNTAIERVEAVVGEVGRDLKSILTQTRKNGD